MSEWEEVCPLLSAAFKKEAACIGSRCAWHDPAADYCAIYTLIALLESLRRLADR